MKQKKILFFPIELYEERYSYQWYHWVLKYLYKLHQKKDVIIIGDTEPRIIKTGQFLDIYDTNIYKANQVSQAIEYLKKNGDKYDYSALFLDLWHPGILNLKYTADCANLGIKITGLFHAGTWDKHDFLTKSVSGEWAKYTERAIIDATDWIIVATKFHKQLITKAHPNAKKYISVEKFPVVNPIQKIQQKKISVVWPHRIADEKRPQDWDKIVKMYKNIYKKDNDIEFFRTKDRWVNKGTYYDQLRGASVAVSTADQETFGIAMLEALNCGCWCVVPDRLSYKELYPKHMRYNRLIDAVHLIRKYVVKSREGIYPNENYKNNLGWLKWI